MTGARSLALVAGSLLVLISPMGPHPGVVHVGAGADRAAIEGPDAASLVERVLEGYGGRAALGRVHAYRMRGRVRAVLQGREGPTLRLYARPNRLRVELNYEGDPELRILDGSRGWRSVGGPPEPASGPLYDAMVLQAARAGVPWVLMQYGGDARRIESLGHRGRPLLGLELDLGGGLTLQVYVDPATNRVEMSRGLLRHGGMETAFQTVYGDYRRVRGVLFAFREENYASGAHTGYTAIERVEVNPRLPAGAFSPPASGGLDL